MKLPPGTRRKQLYANVVSTEAIKNLERQAEVFNPIAGNPAEPGVLVNVPRLIRAYSTEPPNPAVPARRVAFCTSGHRGMVFNGSLNEGHILTITQAICFYRKRRGTDGPLFLGIDTHGLSIPACATALEVLAAGDQGRRCACAARPRRQSGPFRLYLGKGSSAA